jgi:hypothetical protein
VELAKEGQVSKSLENAPALEIRGEIDDSLPAIVENDLDSVPALVGCRNNIVNRRSPPSLKWSDHIRSLVLDVTNKRHRIVRTEAGFQAPATGAV